MVTCPICGIQRKALYKHIFHLHNLKVEEFRRLYPNSPTEDTSVRDNLSISQNKRWSNPEERAKASKVSKKMWENPEYREKSSIARVEGARKQWLDPKSREQRVKHISEAQTNLWKDEDYRKSQIQSFKNKWKDSAYRSRMFEVFADKKEYIRKDGSVVSMRSTYEVTCSEYLDDLGIEYVYEKHPYNIIESDGTLSHYIPDFYLSSAGKFIEVKSDYYYRKDKNEILYRIKYMKGRYGFDVYLVKDWELKNIKNFTTFLIKNGCADTLINLPQNGKS